MVIMGAKQESGKIIDDILERVEYAAELARMDAIKRIETEIDSWIGDGKKVIHESRHEEWEACVRAMLDKKYLTKDSVLTHVQSLDVAINVMYKLMTEPVADVAMEFDRKSYPINVLEFVRNLVLRFAYAGPAFFEATAYREITHNERLLVISIRKENEDSRVLGLSNPNMQK